MKRCPQCLFLFPDSDSLCDFDQTPLEHVDDATIDGVARRPKNRTLPIAVAVGLLLGLLFFAVYYSFIRQPHNASAPSESPTTVTPVATPVTSTSTPEVSPSPAPLPSIASVSKPNSSQTATAHTRATSDPVSTSGPGIATRQGGKPQITLTSGGKIEADEVWRTKDGVWYRRNGMVTLLKRGQVKTIVTR